MMTTRIKLIDNKDETCFGALLMGKQFQNSEFEDSGCPNGQIHIGNNEDDMRPKFPPAIIESLL